MRIYGVEGLQENIRNTIKLAQFFEKYVRLDSRFEIVTEVSMGLVCFRIKVRFLIYDHRLNLLFYYKFLHYYKIKFSALSIRSLRHKKNFIFVLGS